MINRMTKEPEALKLAKSLEQLGDDIYLTHRTDDLEAATIELRRLHEVNAELLEALEWMVANDDTNEGEEPVDSLGGVTWNEYNEYWVTGLNKARAAIAKATGETE
jgi:thioredoxin reductase